MVSMLCPYLQGAGCVRWTVWIRWGWVDLYTFVRLRWDIGAIDCVCVAFRKRRGLPGGDLIVFLESMEMFVRFEIVSGFFSGTRFGVNRVYEY